MNFYKPDIGRLEAQADVASLVDALHHPTPEIRILAAGALGRLRAYDALPHLEHVLRYETEDPVRHRLEQIISFLNEHASQEDATHEDTTHEDTTHEDTTHEDTTHEDAPSTESLIDALSDEEDPNTVIQAAQILSERGDKLAVEPLVMAFRNGRLPIQARLAVAEALLKLESAPVEVTLLATLRHADWHIRRNGAAILGQLRAEWAIQPLFKALSDAHPVVCRTAQAALKHIGTPEARKALAWHAQQRERRAQQASQPQRPSASQQDDDTRSRAPGARPAPPLNRDVLSDMMPRDGVDDTPRPRSIHEERRRRTQETSQLSDTDRLHHAKPTAPLNPDMIEKFERRRKSDDEPRHSGNE